MGIVIERVDVERLNIRMFFGDIKIGGVTANAAKIPDIKTRFIHIDVIRRRPGKIDSRFIHPPRNGADKTFLFQELMGSFLAKRQMRH